MAGKQNNPPTGGPRRSPPYAFFYVAALAELAPDVAKRIVRRDNSDEVTR